MAPRTREEQCVHTRQRKAHAQLQPAQHALATPAHTGYPRHATRGAVSRAWSSPAEQVEDTEDCGPSQYGHHELPAVPLWHAMNRAKGHRRWLLWNQCFASYNGKQRVHNVTRHCASRAAARRHLSRGHWRRPTYALVADHVTPPPVARDPIPDA